MAPQTADSRYLLSVVATFANVALTFVPTFVTDTMMTTLISDAIKPYSMAVAPDWQFQNRIMAFIFCTPDRNTREQLAD